VFAGRVGGSMSDAPFGPARSLRGTVRSARWALLAAGKLGTTCVGGEWLDSPCGSTSSSLKVSDGTSMEGVEAWALGVLSSAASSTVSASGWGSVLSLDSHAGHMLASILLSDRPLQ
jgi:hypothetical protein